MPVCSLSLPVPFPRLALYRALLRQSTSLAHTPSALSASDHTFIRSTILTRFLRDRHLQSPTQIANGLRAGYEALNLLHSCTVNNTNSYHNPNLDSDSSEPSPLTRLTTLISSTRSLSTRLTAHRKKLLAKRPPLTPSLKRRLRHNLRHSLKSAQVGRHGGTKKPVLERPLPLSEIRSGKRKVPSFVVTSAGIPFLRYGKPQPVMLSRVIRQRLEKRDRILEKKNLLDDMLIWAEEEDRWDDTIRRQLSNEKGQNENGGKEMWTKSVDQAVRHNDRRFEMLAKRNAEMGQKLWAVREREKEMAAAEKVEMRARRAEDQTLQRRSKPASLDADVSDHTTPESS